MMWCHVMYNEVQRCKMHRSGTQRHKSKIRNIYVYITLLTFVLTHSTCVWQLFVCCGMHACIDMYKVGCSNHTGWASSQVDKVGALGQDCPRHNLIAQGNSELWGCCTRLSRQLHMRNAWPSNIGRTRQGLGAWIGWAWVMSLNQINLCKANMKKQMQIQHGFHSGSCPPLQEQPIWQPNRTLPRVLGLAGCWVDKKPRWVFLCILQKLSNH